MAQFFYVAAQAGIFSFFINYIVSDTPAVPEWLRGSWLVGGSRGIHEQAGGLDLPDFLSSLIGMSGIAMVAMMFYLVAFRQRGLRTIMDAWRAVARS